MKNELSRPFVRPLGLTFLATLTALAAALSNSANADLVEGRYGANQVWDAQRSPAFPSDGASFTIRGFKSPYSNLDRRQYTIASGQYVQFFYVGGTCTGDNIGIRLYNSDGTVDDATYADGIVSSGGSIYGLGPAFLHNSVPSGYGTVVTNDQAFEVGGTFTYSPYTGKATCDQIADYDANTEPEQVAATNSAPVANNDSVTTLEDVEVLVDVASNDTDEDADDSVVLSSLSIEVPPQNGTAEIINGQILYVPNENFHGTDQLAYTIEDQSEAKSNVALVLINVTSVNDRPVITSTANISATEDVLYHYPLSAQDVEGDPLTWRAGNGTVLPDWLSFQTNDSDPEIFLGDGTRPAGDGTYDSADGSAAENAKIMANGLSFSGGNLYFSEQEEHGIRYVDNAGQLQTLYAGDGEYTSFQPLGIAYDSDRQIGYASFYSQHKVVKIDANGSLSDVSVNINYFPQSVMLNDSNDKLYVAARAGIYEIDLTNLDPASNARLVVGDGAFSGDYSDTGVATTSKIHNPSGMDFTANGDLVFAEQSNHIIRRVNLQNDTITTIAGTAGDNNSAGDGGAAQLASFSNPSGVAVDNDGSIFITERLKKSLRRIDASSGVVDQHLDLSALKGSFVTLLTIGDEGLYVGTESQVFKLPNSAEAALAGTPPQSAVGDHEVCIEVSDASDVSDPQCFTLNVAPVNDPPEMAVNSGAAVDEGGVVVITTNMLAAVDEDDQGDGLVFTVNSAPANGQLFLDRNQDGLFGAEESIAENQTFTQASIDNNLLSYLHDGSETLSDQFVFSLADGQEDGAAAIVNQTFSISVRPVNDAPQLSGSPIGVIDEDSLYRYELMGSDVDSDDLTYLAENLPSWLSLDSATGVLSGTPTNDDVGTTEGIVLTVTDGDLSTSLPAFSLTVNNTNDAPVITGSPSLLVDEDSGYVFTPMASDVDSGDNLVFSAENLPSWASIDPVTGTITGTPRNDDVGTFRDIIVTVSDGTTTTSLPPFSLTVANTNDAPVAASDSYSTSEGGLLQVDARDGVLANDNDIDVGDTLTASLISGPAHAGNFTLNSDGSFNYRHNGSETRSDSFTYALSDGTVTLPATMVTIAIAAVNDAPRFISTPDQLNLTPGDRFRYTPITTDPDSVVNVAYSQGPSWLTFDGTSLSGRVPLDAAIGSQTIILTASDQSFEVQQSAELTIVERDTALINIATSWQGLPALAGKTLSLTALLSHSSGPPVADGELIVTIQGDDPNAIVAGCTATTSEQYTCPYSLSAGASQTQKITLSRESEGDIIVTLSARDLVTQTEVGSAITDVSVTDVAVGQGNVAFNLANATSLASIDLDGQGNRELVAGTKLGGEVVLLRYDVDNANAEAITTIDNTGFTRQVQVADINGDSLEDIVVVNDAGDATNIYYQNGNLSFAVDSQTQALPFATRSLLADLNNDNHPELILGGRGNRLYVYPNVGGVYSQAPFVLTSPVEVVHFALIGQAGASAPYSGELAISTQDALKLVRFNLSESASQKVANDVAYNDVVYKAGSEAAAEQVLTYQELDSLPISGITELISQDLDNDGEQELIVSRSHSDNSANQSGVSIVKFTDGTLQLIATLGKASAKQVGLADFNGDGSLDILVANDNGSYQFYYGDGSATGWHLKDTIIFNPSTLVLPEDIDNDGLADVLIYEDETDQANLYLSASDGTLGQSADLSVVAETYVLNKAQYQWQYSATVTNPAAEAVNNVTLTIDLPAGVNVASKPELCNVAATSVSCWVDSLPAGSETFTFTLAATSKPSGSASAFVTSDALDSDITNNTATNEITPLFTHTQARVEGGGKSGGASGWLAVLIGGLVAIFKGRLGRGKFGRSKFTLAMLSLLALSGQSNADQTMYIEASLGRASSHWNASGLHAAMKNNAQEITVTNVDDKRGTQELLFGYRLLPMLAIELGYRDWGEISYSLEGVASSPDAVLGATQSYYPASGKGAFAGLRASYWHGDNLEGYAKLSAWDWSGDYTTIINSEAHSFAAGDTDIVVSVGLNGYFYERYSAGVVYQTTRLEGQRNVMVGVSLGVRF
ncbi:MAG TPA: Ig-like domain-containing protein [Marinagarivorans sp.]